MISMGSGLVDVLLPVFNGASTISLALNSLRQQTVQNLRIIVIDDGSTDATPEILARAAAADPRITLLTRRNSGIVDALNAGLTQCTGEFVARQDADDISEPERIALQVSYLARHPACVAVSGAIYHIDAIGRAISPTPQVLGDPENANPFWIPSREPYLIHPFVMVRRIALQAIGGYRRVFHSEDTDLYWRLQERGRLHNLSTPLGRYRMHPESISSGSIINGRIMALNSQLAAISAVRRRAKKADIRFDEVELAHYQRAGSLKNMYTIARIQLNSDEARYLRIAASAKLIELTSYRPYELQHNDCLFIRQSRQELNLLSKSNVSELNDLTSRAAARLFSKGLFREAALLVHPALFAPTGARVLTRIGDSITRRAMEVLFGPKQT
jgi:glycosyltransferase involved in cell wall biosynthesis